MPEQAVRDVLARSFGDDAGGASGAFVADGMNIVELVRFHELILTHRAVHGLEIGFANGTSAVVACDALLRTDPKARLTSVDPFARTQYGSAGLDRLRTAGFESAHQLIDEPDYVALPRLVTEGAKFDFVFIDGYHSFDHTLIDLFYADLLLEDGGILAIHDTTWPSVYKAVKFLETQKPYERLSPPIMVELKPFASRAFRRLTLGLKGSHAREAARARREEWLNLAAYRKLASKQAEEETVPQF
jgi:hypothetical protein